MDIRKSGRNLFERLWRRLPDRCEMPGCCRQGVRGNENVIGGKVVCDYCHARLMIVPKPTHEEAERERFAIQEALHGFDHHALR